MEGGERETRRGRVGRASRGREYRGARERDREGRGTRIM